jgi:hypothetical protein
MKPRRKVLAKEWMGTVWALRLECGHVAYRSVQYSERELPEQTLCEACNWLIGSQVKNPLGKFGTISSYSGGLFDITWQNDGSTRLTLDELREKAEIL